MTRNKSVNPLLNILSVKEKNTDEKDYSGYFNYIRTFVHGMREPQIQPRNWLGA
jgi:hypothetical protein